MDYKTTLNLPRTDFPMKANLAQREPEMVRRWAEGRVYERLLAANAEKPRFVLHDRPPYANGHIHLGKKPVLWCPSCATALAEAEVESRDDESPSVYVAYPFVEPLPAALRGVPAPAAAIWTTTPWTLPASLAVAVHPEHEYVAAAFGERTLVVAAALVPALAPLLGTARVLARFRGAELEGGRCRHPWLDPIGPPVLARYLYP